ncbi:RAxF-45 family protein [Bacillus sp. THAF10]|nr:RAxF-45 family protein [Bacillus sp. THAF10]
MLLSVRACTQYMAYLHICRAQIHDSAANGTGLSIFKQLNRNNR